MGKLKEKARRTMTNAERIEFAKQLEEFYESSHADPKKIFGYALLKGVGTGLGVFLGGTIVVGLLAWLLSQFSHLPFVDEISHAAEHSTQAGPSNAHPDH